MAAPPPPVFSWSLLVTAVALVVGAARWTVFLDVATLVCGFVVGAMMHQSSKKEAKESPFPLKKPPPVKREVSLEEKRCLLEVDEPSVALRSEAYARTLLSRKDRPQNWIQKKFEAAVNWRESFDGDGALDKDLAKMLEERLLRRQGSRREPLLSTESLENASRLLKSGFFYWKGLGNRGRPVIWNHSGAFDFRSLPKGSEPNFVRAICTMLEVGVLATVDDDSEDDGGRLAYVECTQGLTTSNFPLTQGWRVLSGVISGFLVGYPERGATFLVGPSTLLTRILFTLATPILPKSMAQRISLVDQRQIPEKIADLLGDPLKIPTFFGGSYTHDLPRHDTTGHLDLLTMLKDLLDAKAKLKRKRRRRRGKKKHISEQSSRSPRSASKSFEKNNFASDRR